MRLPSTLIAAALLTIPPAGAQAERPVVVDASPDREVTFAYRFARGDGRNFVLSGQFLSEGLEGTSGARTTTSVRLPLTVEVQTVDDGGNALLAVSMRNPEVTLEEDGRSATSRGLADALRSSRLTRTVARDGTVVGSGGEIVVGGASNVNAAGFIVDTIAMSWVQFPNEPLSVGDSWLQTIPLELSDPDSGLSASVSARYTLAGFADVAGRQQAVIDVLYLTSVDGQTQSPSGRSVRVVGRGRGVGHIVFDFQRGQLTQLEVETGVVLTGTENNGVRTSHAFSSSASIRAQVVAAVDSP